MSFRFDEPLSFNYDVISAFTPFASLPIAAGIESDSSTTIAESDIDQFLSSPSENDALSGTASPEDVPEDLFVAQLQALHNAGSVHTVPAPAASIFETFSFDTKAEITETEEAGQQQSFVNSTPLFSSFKLNGSAAANGLSNNNNNNNNKGKESSHKRKSSDSDDGETGTHRLSRHNQSEKKRRDNMNEYIALLHQLVPALHTIHKPSKGTILNKTIEYVKRLQQKSAKLESTVAQQQEDINKLRSSNQVLVQMLSEHGIIVPSDGPTSPVDIKLNASTSSSAGYYMQDAGRVMLLVTALLFFFYAPWSLPTAGGQQANFASDAVGRSLLSIPAALYSIQGLSMFSFWIIARWVVMSSLLLMAMYWDTLYCNDSILRSLPKVRELNKLAEECMSMGDYLKAKEYTEDALGFLRRPVPKSNFDLFFGNLYQSARQIAHRCIMGLVFERFLIYSTGKMEYAAELQRVYLNMTQQNHCLPEYNKWHDLYIILCSVNFSEILEGDTGQGLVQAYGALCYHVIVHSRVFEVIASIYQSLAFGVVQRLGLNKPQFGNFYIVLAYRNLMKGHFPLVFDNLQKGIEMHKMLNLVHHQRECIMMKGWIELILGRSSDSFQSFFYLYEWSNQDLDHYNKRWAMLGLIANYQQTGQNDKVSEWLSSGAVLEGELRMINNHQEIFSLGFTALLHLRECFEDGALDVANKALARLQETVQSGMPHNVMPLWKTTEVHVTLFERYLLDDSEASKIKAERLCKLCKQDLDVFTQFIEVFPLMESAYLLFYGRVLFLTKQDTEKSLDVLRRARENARSFNLKYMEGLALFEIGRLLPLEDKQRQSSLEEALQIFRDQDSAYEEQLTMAEMQTRGAPRLFTPKPKILA